LIFKKKTSQLILNEENIGLNDKIQKVIQSQSMLYDELEILSLTQKVYVDGLLGLTYSCSYIKDGIKIIRLIHSGDFNIGGHFEILEREERFYRNKSKINSE
jgi:hypothetical protein